MTRTEAEQVPFNVADVRIACSGLTNVRLDQFPRTFENGLERAAVALKIFDDPTISTEKLMSLAANVIQGAMPSKETFVPIFLTNHCHASCKMCGMRKGNDKLHRAFSTKSQIEEQLKILYHAEHVRAVGFLTGEYQDSYTRLANAFLVGWALSRAFELGFERTYFNIGSLTAEEVAVLADWVRPHQERPTTMCVFQETYDLNTYEKFMGRAGQDGPKTDYFRRMRSYDNWLEAGFKYVNPGFLVGLNAIDEDMCSLMLHVDKLLRRGATVSISLPRLRPALGASNRSIVSDEVYLRVIATVALVCPNSRIVLTTREDEYFQDKALPIIGTLSPGSPDVSPYKWDDTARNDPESSQFLIPDHRRPRDILGRLVDRGFDFRYFVRSESRVE